MKTPSFLGQLKSIVLLPMMVVAVVPYVLLSYFPALPGPTLVFVSDTISYGVGIPLVVLGFLLFLQAVVLFIKIGRGTLAPWDPTKKMVIKGLYRHVRNPMIIGVLLMLLGESILFNSILVLFWAALFFGINHLYFISWEEPEFEKRFGNEYLEYRKNVRRWLPRLDGWRPEDN